MHMIFIGLIPIASCIIGIQFCTEEEGFHLILGNNRAPLRLSIRAILQGKILRSDHSKVCILNNSMNVTVNSNLVFLKYVEIRINE